jgi:hypothetical protein
MQHLPVLISLFFRENPMLIKFKSKAAADIVMYKEHAERILELLGKDTERGIILPQDTEQAIRTIEAAIAESRAHPISEQVDHDVKAHPQPNENGDHEHERATVVSFASRAYPFLEMLRAAREQNREIVWGV